MTKHRFEKLCEMVAPKEVAEISSPKKRVRVKPGHEFVPVEDCLPKKRRGRDLENRIERVFNKINALPDILAIRLEVRQARKNDSFVWCKKQPFDYLVIAKSKVFAFDAKECSCDTWYPSKAPAHQISSLQKLQALGHVAGFLVWFRANPSPCAIRFIEDFDHPATCESGRLFGWDMFFEKE